MQIDSGFLHILDIESSEDLKVYSDTFAKLSLYCDLTLLAREARLAGNIETALMHENTLDRLYNNLPEEFKW